MVRRLLACVALVCAIEACKTSNEGSGLASEDGNEAPAPGATGAAGASTAKPVAVLDDLKTKSADDLYALFRDGKGDGQIPLGHGVGYPILMADAPTLNSLANKIWGGKEFKKETAASGAEVVTLKNFIGPLTVIRAKVVAGKISDARPTLADSLVDDKPSIVLNYGDAELGTVAPFNKIVDEIRLVNPATKLYLGRAFMAETFVCYFALQFTE